MLLGPALGLSVFYSSLSLSDEIAGYLRLNEIEKQISFWKSLYQDYSNKEILYVDPFNFELVDKNFAGTKIQTSGQRDSAISLFKNGQKYQTFIDHELENEGLSHNLIYMMLLESGGNPSVVSPKGAAGLWQLMPATAKEMDLNLNKMVDDRLNPVLSTRAAIKLLKKYHRTFENWPLTITAYNYGIGNVLNRIRQNNESIFESINSFNYETKNYFYKMLALIDLEDEFTHRGTVETVLADEYSVTSLPFSFSYQKLRRFLESEADSKLLLNHIGDAITKTGFNIPAYTQIVIPNRLLADFEQMTKTYRDGLIQEGLLKEYRVESGDGMLYLAEKLETPYSKLKWLNDMESDNLKIGKKLFYAPKQHVVQEGETIEKIANLYKVSLNAIKRINLLPKKPLQTGIILDIP